MEFHFLRPRSHYRTGRNAALLRGDAPAYPAGRPDLTKLVRAAEDALKGVVWADDGQVVGQGNRKVYGEKPGVRICVRRVTRSGIGNHPIGEDWLS
jgi:Holliday junction resolvase RusA-like endonuclease